MPYCASSGIEQFDSVIIRVRNQQTAVPSRQAQRMLQANVVARPVYIAKIKQVAADQRAHVSIRPEIDRANDICLSVRDIQSLSVRHERGRLRKRCLRRRAVDARLASRARKGRDLLLVEIELPDLMRPGHRDVERAADKLQIRSE